MGYLGIDGGGTKTRAVITDPFGRVLADVELGAMNPHGLSQENVVQEISRMIRLLAEQYPLEQIKTAFAGMSGVDHPGERRKILDLFYRELPDTLQLEVSNDALIALSSGTYGGPGIVLIAGTGSIAFARLGNGTIHRAGGWGYLFGDEGSGYAMGRRALVAVMQAYDGRGPATALTDKILEKANCGNPVDLIPIIYGFSDAKRWIASCSREVMIAFDAGDFIAHRIVQRTILEQKLQIDALLEKTQSNKEPLPIVLTGGLYQHVGHIFLPRLQELFIQQGQEDVAADCLVPELPPVAGAIIEALKMDKLQFDSQEVRTEFKTNWNSGRSPLVE